jgi:hypothetical protein
MPVDALDGSASPSGSAGDTGCCSGASIPSLIVVGGYAL